MPDNLLLDSGTNLLQAHSCWTLAPWSVYKHYPKVNFFAVVLNISMQNNINLEVYLLLVTGSHNKEIIMSIVWPSVLDACLF